MAKPAKTEAEAEKDKQIADYNKVVQVAELGEIQLFELNFSVSPDYYHGKEDAKLGYIVKTDSTFYDPDANFAACLVSFEVEAKHDEDIVLNCSAKYTATYNLSEACEKEAIEKFLNRVAVFACYPYFRGIFANLDWSANTRLPPLPIHKEDVKRTPKPKARKKAAKTIEVGDE